MEKDRSHHPQQQQDNPLAAAPSTPSRVPKSDVSVARSQQKQQQQQQQNSRQPQQQQEQQPPPRSPAPSRQGKSPPRGGAASSSRQGSSIGGPYAAASSPSATSSLHNQYHHHDHHSQHGQQFKEEEVASATSLSDQVLASALAGTLEFLKLAGGLTWTATGAVVAPPLHVTRTIILPQLWAATVDVLTQFTPLRLQDWFRIVQSAVLHFVHVLTTTERGYEFRHRFTVVATDVLDILSSSATRQVLVDATASMVKLAQALYTPESLACLQQTSIWACHAMEAFSSGRAQRAVCDIQQLVWSACALWADPQTIAALAEVTAYLCYALEMEDAVFLDHGTGGSSSVGSKKDAAAQRRKERDAYQKATYQHRSLLSNPHTTVEQAILSSLGCSNTTAATTTTNLDEIEENSDDNESTQDDGVSEAEYDPVFGGAVSETSSIRRQVIEQQSEKENEKEKKEARLWDNARRNVDVDYLNQHIHRQPPSRVVGSIHPPPLQVVAPKSIAYRNENAVNKYTTTITCLGGVQYVEDAASSPVLVKEGKPRNRASSSERKKIAIGSARVETVGDDSDDDDDEKDENKCPWPPASPKTPVVEPMDKSRTPLPKYKGEENESLTEYFHRVLDELLAQKRMQGVDLALQQVVSASSESSATASYFARPGLCSSTTAAAAAAASKDSVRHRLDALRFELSQQQQPNTTRMSWPPRTLRQHLQKPPTGNDNSSSRTLINNRRLAWLILTVLVVLGGTWFGLGCYGIYALLRQQSSTAGVVHIMRPAGGFDATTTTTLPPAAANEIVIRIVREVVHVDSSTGEVLGRSSADSAAKPWNQEQIDRVSQCIAAQAV